MDLVEKVSKDLEREIRFGSQLLERRERFINQQAAAEARAWKQDVRFKKQKTTQHYASIPAEEFFAFATQPGFEGCWNDEGFVGDYLKRNTHLRSNR